MKKIFITVLVLLGTCTFASAQDETDALFFSQQQAGTTARSIGIGGAVGSVGADFATLGVNPAALGRYSKDELTITPSFNMLSTPTMYSGSKMSNSNTKFNMQNIGWVTAARNNSRRSGLRSSGFALGFNKVANFNREYLYSGQTSGTSLMDAVAKRINNSGGSTYLFGGGAYVEDLMAYNTYLIDRASDTMQVRSYVPTGALQQSKSYKAKGAINELAVSLGANYNDEIYIGGTLGLPLVNYAATTIYTELDKSGNINNDFASLQQSTYRQTNGLGANLKFGLIYLPKTSNLRVGAAFHGPTWFSLTDEYRFALNANVENLLGAGNGQLSEGTVVTPDPNFTLISDYKVSTPYKAVLSGTYMFGKQGFLSADVDMVNYKSSRVKFATDAAYTSLITQVIQNEYKTAANARVGAEMRADNFSFRAGAAYFGNPYALGSKYGTAARTQLSAGVGFRSTSFFMDAAYAYTAQAQKDFPYVYENNGVLNTAARVANNGALLALTIGWKY
jgi:hypothetical protein